MKKYQNFDEYLEELEKKQEKEAYEQYCYGGGYEAAKGDWEGACLARAEYEAGHFA